MTRKQKALHWFRVPAPEELGDASAVQAGTTRVDAEGRPFQSTKAGRRRPSEWSRRWFETPAQLRRRESTSRLLTRPGFTYLFVVLGVDAVAIVEGWAWNEDVLSPIMEILPGLVAFLVPRVWGSFVLSAPAAATAAGPAVEA